jgi:putative colanic acid biosynthesis acetyltransferase WcaF
MKKTAQLKDYNNSHFYTGAGKFKRSLWHIVNSVFFNSPFHFYALKSWLLKLFGAEVGIGVIIKPRVNIKYPWNLKIGNHVWIGENVWIDSLVSVKIGDNVCISQGALLLCGNHNYKKSSFDLITGSIVLEEGVWIGAKSIVCPGVICSNHSVLSVLSVATKNLEEYSIYQGNPAVKIKTRIIE